jgi:ABC-type bacteriocin/lantibiotic exporter with double-glycine peptidase domain
LLYEADGKNFKQIRSDGTNTSGGERQRISLARAIFFDSDLIILDEPSSALDEESRNKVHNFIQKFQKLKTVLIITHDQNLINYCSNVVSIKNKTINFYGKIDEYLEFKNL